jgi:hypothetical protein
MQKKEAERRNIMTNTKKHLITALVISITLVALNIIAVTQASGANYYSVIEQFVIRILS